MLKALPSNPAGNYQQQGPTSAQPGAGQINPMQLLGALENRFVAPLSGYSFPQGGQIPQSITGMGITKPLSISAYQAPPTYAQLLSQINPSVAAQGPVGGSYNATSSNRPLQTFAPGQAVALLKARAGLT